jgi:hypothetical protein
VISLVFICFDISYYISSLGTSVGKIFVFLSTIKFFCFLISFDQFLADRSQDGNEMDREGLRQPLKPLELKDEFSQSAV